MLEKIIVSGIFLSLVFSCERSEAPLKEGPDFFTGMDLSYQLFLEDKAIFYRDENDDIIFNPLKYLYENGVDLVRLRLFHTPSAEDPIVYACRLEKVLEYANSANQLGMAVLLDIHYSDTWADPGKQYVPSAWQGKSFQSVKDSVYQYTWNVLEAFRNKGFYPDFVQIGNETNSGFLWDYGKVWGDFNDNWSSYGQLVAEASRAIDAHEEMDDVEIRKIIHIAGVVDRHYFFDELTGYFEKFDVIGLTHYSHHNTQDLEELQSELNFLANRFDKEIMIVETNYAWTLADLDRTPNRVNDHDDLVKGYSATPLGQKLYYEEITRILKNVPGNKALGFVWWAPDYVAWDGPLSTKGSSFDNLGVFDEYFKILPVIQVFRDN